MCVCRPRAVQHQQDQPFTLALRIEDDRGEPARVVREVTGTADVLAVLVHFPLGDPVAAWADIVSDPERARRYKQVRGKGGLVRASWEEAVEMVAAAHVHTIKEYGPDRLAGFSPIPAMSMVSHAAGARFYSLLGGAMLSFYDWYADLPVASPQKGPPEEQVGLDPYASPVFLPDPVVGGPG